MLVVCDSVVCGSVPFLDPLLCSCYCFNFFFLFFRGGVRKKIFVAVLNRSKNLVRPDGQGKSQSQDFIDKFRGLGHTLFLDYESGMLVPTFCH